MGMNGFCWAQYLVTHYSGCYRLFPLKGEHKVAYFFATILFLSRSVNTSSFSECSGIQTGDYCKSLLPAKILPKECSLKKYFSCRSLLLLSFLWFWPCLDTDTHTNASSKTIPSTLDMHSALHQSQVSYTLAVFCLVACTESFLLNQNAPNYFVHLCLKNRQLCPATSMRFHSVPCITAFKKFCLLYAG